MTRGALLIAGASAASPGVAHTLAKTGYVLEDALSIEDACRILHADGPDLVICCGNAANTADACRQIRGENFSRYIYVIAVLRRRDVPEIVATLEAGADDCFCEPVDAAEFAARLHVAERILDRDRELSFLTRCDPLTDLLNRRSLFELMEKEFSRADRYGQVLSCAMLDIDNLKVINDTHGHLAGDAVLCAVARELERSLRQSEFVCRYGGDEFCILMPQTDLRGAQVCAERCLQSIAALRIGYGGDTLRVSASMGTAERPPGAGDVASFLNRADQALLDAKRQGKNRVSFG